MAEINYDDLTDEQLDNLIQRRLKSPETVKTVPSSSVNYDSLSDDDLNNLIQNRAVDQSPEDRGIKEKEDLGIRTSPLQEKIGRSIPGVMVGVGEAFNPLAIPHGLETLGRGAAKFAFGERLPNEGLGEKALRSLKEGSESAYIPEMRVEDVAPALRAGVRSVSEDFAYPFTGKSPTSFSDSLEQEKSAQELFTSGFPEESRMIGEIGPGVVSLGALAKKGIENLPTLVGKMEALKNIKNTLKSDSLRSLLGSSKGARPDKYMKEANELQRKLIGDLAPELQDALYKRTGNVRRLVEEGSRSGAMENVASIRRHIDDTQEMIGETVGGVRRVLLGNNEQSFDTKNVQKILRSVKGKSKLSGGRSYLDPKDEKLLLKYETMLKNPSPKGVVENDAVTVGDVVKIIDHLDDDLDPFYKGSKNTRTLQALSRLRRELDSGIEDLSPVYKVLKNHYTDFLDRSSSLRRKIDSLGGESFLSNLFNRNKTEAQIQLESLLNKQDEFAKDLGSISMRFKTGSLKQNKKLAKVLTPLREKASKTTSKSGRDFLNDIADRITSEKLKTVTDKDADELSRIINSYVKTRTAAAEATGATIGGIIGWKSMGEFGGLGGAYAGSKIAGAISRPLAQRRAEKLYDYRRIFDLISKSKSKSSQKAKDVLFIWDKFGPSAAQKLVSSMPATPDFTRAWQAFSIGVPISTSPSSIVDMIREKSPSGRNY